MSYPWGTLPTMAVTDAQYRRFAAALHVATQAYPNLRLGQIIVNACGGDPFHVEDDNLIDSIWGYVTEVMPNLPDFKEEYR